MFPFRKHILGSGKGVYFLGGTVFVALPSEEKNLNTLVPRAGSRTPGTGTF
jgi:hypothetical protein